MSSIYDALRRIQGEKGTWAAPRESKEQPSRSMNTIGWIVACAVVLSSVCTAGIYYGIRRVSEDKAPQAALTVPARPSPSPVAAAPPQPQALPAGVPLQQAAPPAQAAPLPVPDTVDGYLKAGDQYFLAHDYANALLTYNKALHYFGKDVRVLNNIGSVYLSQGQPEKAIHYFNESNGIAKEYVEPVYNLACAYARLGDPAKAILNLKKACKLDPEAKKWAASDPDLMTLKGRREFDRLIGAQ